MNESDLRSDVHYLGSSENKAWIFFFEKEQHLYLNKVLSALLLFKDSVTKHTIIKWAILTCSWFCRSTLYALAFWTLVIVQHAAFFIISGAIATQGNDNRRAKLFATGCFLWHKILLTSYIQCQGSYSP